MKRWKKVVLFAFAGMPLMLVGGLGAGVGWSALVNLLSGIVPEAQALEPLALGAAAFGVLGFPYVVFREK
ncbi:hypothetical protein [Halorussus pelagicus]|uniref:hypothetical protein n=1 Tax=Halorussus pelagicus TaxID=2505977 RepID=UPI000FFC95B0|nr:hypothetical protein [Halorussus pelagicus]